MSLRDLLLRAEPLFFAAVSPILHSSKARIQRSFAAQRYLKGRGAEVGAFTQSILTPRGSKTLYIDRVPASHWVDHPEFKNSEIIDPDIVDDGIHLSKVEDNSLDYLIASHVLEHADDPILALKNWTRVVRPGGHMLIIVPDKRFTFDKDRPLTTVEHLIRDHNEGPAWSAEDHYRDVAINYMGLTDETKIQAYVSENEPAIHFHTWTLESFVEFLLAASRFLGDIYELVEAKLNVGEDLCVLKVK